MVRYICIRLGTSCTSSPQGTGSQLRRWSRTRAERQAPVSQLARRPSAMHRRLLRFGPGFVPHSTRTRALSVSPSYKKFDPNITLAKIDLHTTSQAHCPTRARLAERVLRARADRVHFEPPPTPDVCPASQDLKLLKSRLRRFVDPAALLRYTATLHQARARDCEHVSIRRPVGGRAGAQRSLRVRNRRDSRVRLL
jgi:hypothetical protein